ncbi:MAG: lipid-A-disaccharide synthase [Armatimonadota bacterium]
MDRTPQVFVVAGEPSADQHGAMLGEALRRRCQVRLTGVGQRRMRDAGFELRFDSTGWSGIGVVQSLSRVPMLMVRMHQLTIHLVSVRPDLLVLMDFGAFNVRLARRLRRELTSPILYYFPPRSWSRDADYRTLRGVVDRVATPFPWSEGRLREAGIDARWVGHPVIDRIEPAHGEGRVRLRRELGLNAETPLVGMLPGSRSAEVRCNGPVMLGAAKLIIRDVPEMRFLLSVAPSIPRRLLERQVDRAGLTDRVLLLEGVSEIVRAADMVVSSAGTATLEAAAALCPMVIIYRGTWLMRLERLLRRFRVDSVGMPNIVAGERVVPELIGGEARPSCVAAAALALLGDEPRRAAVVRGLQRVRDRLGEPGVSDRVAAMASEMMGADLEADDQLRKD